MYKIERESFSVEFETEEEQREYLRSEFNFCYNSYIRLWRAENPIEIMHAKMELDKVRRLHSYTYPVKALY